MIIAYDKVAHFYDDYMFFQHEKKYFNNLIKFIHHSLIKGEKQNILDIACGTGNSLAPFVKGNDCTGIDISSKMLDIAKTKFANVDFYKMDFRSFNFNKKFDLILCLFDSLNHTEDLASVFRSVKNHLEKEGVFVFDYYTEYGLNESIKSNNDILAVKKVKSGIYEWSINVDKTIFSITEYVIPMKKLIENLKSAFKIKLFNQNFEDLKLENILGEGEITLNQIERIIVIASLK